MCPAIPTEPAPNVASGLGADSLSRAAAALPEFIAIAIVARAQSNSEAIAKV
jgi:hypothetical protein